MGRARAGDARTPSFGLDPNHGGCFVHEVGALVRIEDAQEDVDLNGTVNEHARLGSNLDANVVPLVVARHHAGLDDRHGSERVALTEADIQLEGLEPRIAIASNRDADTTIGAEESRRAQHLDAHRVIRSRKSMCCRDEQHERYEWGQALDRSAH
jgi:hypothetical protein